MDSPIVKLADALSTAVTLSHARGSLTQDEIRTLWELHANLFAALPQPWWLSVYAAADRNDDTREGGTGRWL